MKRITVQLTPVQIDHILTLLEAAHNAGYYYGPRDAYMKRQEGIARLLIDRATANGVTLSPHWAELRPSWVG